MPRPRDTSITFTCAQCGASFHPWPGEEGAAMRYCSRACYNAAQKANGVAQRAASPTKGRAPMRRNLDVTKSCEHCHQPYHPYAGHEETHRFCSQTCARGHALARVDPAVVFGEKANEGRRAVLARWAAEGRPLVFKGAGQGKKATKPNKPKAAGHPQDKGNPSVERKAPPTLPTLADAMESLEADVQEPQEPVGPIATTQDRPGLPLRWPIENDTDRAEWYQVGTLRQGQADRALRQDEARHEGRTIIVAGQGSSLWVELGDLMVKPGRTHGGAGEWEVVHPALHDVRRILWVGVNDRMGGSLTLAALAWLRREGIELVILDGSGSPLASSWPNEMHDAPLRRAQWSLSGSPAGAALAREILRQKIDAQAATLDAHPELPGQMRALAQFKTWQAWLSLPKPPAWQYDLDRLRLIEARLARQYFGAWLGLPLPFAKTDLPRIPSYWLAARERTSPLAPAGNARHSVDPLNSLLNYAYACLASQCRQALVSAGLDIACGFLHADKAGRDSLTYDLCELERATVDHLLLSLLSKTTLHRADFLRDKGGLVTLHPQTVRLVLAACRVPQAQADGHARWLRD